MDASETPVSMWKVFGITTTHRVPDCKSSEVSVYDTSLPTARSIKMESHLHEIFQFTCSWRLTINNNSQRTLWCSPTAWRIKSTLSNEARAPFLRWPCPPPGLRQLLLLPGPSPGARNCSWNTGDASCCIGCVCTAPLLLPPLPSSFSAAFEGLVHRPLPGGSHL